MASVHQTEFQRFVDEAILLRQKEEFLSTEACYPLIPRDFSVDSLAASLGPQPSDLPSPIDGIPPSLSNLEKLNPRQRLQREVDHLAPTEESFLDLKSMPSVNYKTKLCPVFSETGCCPHSSACGYAHRPAELRTLADNRSAINSISILANLMLARKGLAPPTETLPELDRSLYQQQLQCLQLRHLAGRAHARSLRLEGVVKTNGAAVSLPPPATLGLRNHCLQAWQHMDRASTTTPLTQCY